MSTALKQDELDLIDVDQVREDLKAFIHSNQGSKITQREVAMRVGVSPAQITGFLKGTYPNPEKLAYALRQMMDLHSRREEAVWYPAYTETSMTDEILAIVNYAHEQKDIGVIYGNAGIGKTMALTQYCNENPGTVFITANVTMSGSKAVLEEIMDTLGLKEFGDRRRMRRTIVNALRGSGRLVIIDEAQHLSLKALECVRSVYDECGIGLVLAGNDQVYTSMLGKKGAPFAQLFSRVGIRRALTPTVKLEDVRKIVTKDMEVSADCLEYLTKIANTPGGIRLAVKLCALARRIARGLGEKLSVDSLQSAYDFMMQYPWR